MAIQGKQIRAAHVFASRSIVRGDASKDNFFFSFFAKHKKFALVPDIGRNELWSRGSARFLDSGLLHAICLLVCSSL